MGFLSKIIDGINNFASDMASSFSTDATCAKCIKCKQCVKTLSDGRQVRVFTCPAACDSVYNNEYIDSLLPTSYPLTTEYLEAYQNNRDAIYNYLYSDGGLLFLDSATPLVNDKYTPILTFNELKYCYKAMECPMFKGFIDTDNIMNINDTLISCSYPEIYDFDSLPRKDQEIIMARNDF